MIAAGGTSIFIRNDLLHRKLDLNKDLQALQSGLLKDTSHLPNAGKFLGWQADFERHWPVWLVEI